MNESSTEKERKEYLTRIRSEIPAWCCLHTCGLVSLYELIRLRSGARMSLGVVTTYWILEAAKFGGEPNR